MKRTLCYMCNFVIRHNWSLIFMIESSPLLWFSHQIHNLLNTFRWFTYIEEKHEIWQTFGYLASSTGQHKIPQIISNQEFTMQKFNAGVKLSNSGLQNIKFSLWRQVKWYHKKLDLKISFPKYYICKVRTCRTNIYNSRASTNKRNKLMFKQGNCMLPKQNGLFWMCFENDEVCLMYLK